MQYNSFTMKNKSIFIPIIIIAILAGIVGWMLGKKNSTPVITSTETSSGIVNKIEKVFKLVASEGNVSEIYDYKDYDYYDIPIFRKKMLVRVNAKVLIGYDFEKVKFSIDEINKTIRLDSMQSPEILAIDHNLDYYDIQEGTFNSFTEKEMTELAERAKQFAAKTAEESQLYASAEDQKEELLEMIQLASTAFGWKFEYSENVLLD